MIRLWRGPYRGCKVGEPQLPPPQPPSFVESWELYSLAEAVGRTVEQVTPALFWRRRARWKRLRQRRILDAGSQPAHWARLCLARAQWPPQGSWEG